MLRMPCLPIIIRFSTLLLVLMSFSALGQNTSLGFGIGGLSYSGDLQPAFRVTESRLAARIFYDIHPKHPFHFRFGIMAGGLRGEDDGHDIESRMRAASFKGRLLEANALMEYHFFDMRKKYPPFSFSPYVFGGLAAFSLRAEDALENDYRDSGMAIPFGVGISVPVSQSWAINLEFGARRTFSTTLDNISELATSKYRGGNPNRDDFYYLLGLNLRYTFYKINCPISPY